METTTLEPCVQTKNETENRDRLKAYADYYSEEQCRVILEMIDVVQNGFFYRENSPYGIDRSIMTRLGYKTYDTAKPQPYMDHLRETGVPNEMLLHTVYDYTENKWGQLSNYLCRYWDYLSHKLT